MTPPKQSEDEIVAVLDALAYGGSSIGSVVAGPSELIGKKVLVPFTVPGETAAISVARDEKRLLHANLLRVIKSSPERREPPCPKFGVCGGCDLQHMNIAAQRSEKLKMVLSTLKAKGGVVPSDGAELAGGSLAELRYRKRISLHLNPAGELGFYKQGTGDVVDLEECLLADTTVSAALKKLRPLAAAAAEHVSKVTLQNSGGEAQAILELREKSPRGAEDAPQVKAIVEAFGGVKILKKGEVILTRGPAQEAAGLFSQVNEEGNSLLISKVLSLVETDEATDLFAGAGNFSLPLARAGKTVDAVEVNPALAGAGAAAAREAGFDNIKFFEMSCERFLKAHRLRSTVVLDPPRSGAKEVAVKLSPGEIQKIVYVSCNLPTLTRDLALLRDRGFSLKKVFVVDMFAQTHHVETISELAGA